MSVSERAVRKLEQVMKIQGWSQNRAAKTLGYDQRTVNRWVRRIHRPDGPWARDLLAKLAEYDEVGR